MITNSNGSWKLQGPPAISSHLGYPWVQKKAQRRMGPIPGWNGPAPKGSEIFVSKIPKDFNEDDLYPVFSQAGDIYEMRLTMDLFGFNRGYGFVRYTMKEIAESAVKILNGFFIKDNVRLFASMSVDNSRLFVGALPRTATRNDVLQTFNSLVPGIVDVIMYQDFYRKELNRGFAFLEFESHEMAAAARRIIMPNPDTRLGRLMIDWAEPEPEVKENVMKQVKILYVRNLLLETTDYTLKKVFNLAIYPNTVVKIKKIDDYAFVHFSERADAEKALRTLENANIDGVDIHIEWARPVPLNSNYKNDNSCDSSDSGNAYSQESLQSSFVSEELSLYQKDQNSHTSDTGSNVYHERNNMPALENKVMWSQDKSYKSVDDSSKDYERASNSLEKSSKVDFHKNFEKTILNNDSGTDRKHKKSAMNSANNPWCSNSEVKETNVFFKNNQHMLYYNNNANFVDSVIWKDNPSKYLNNFYQNWLMYDVHLDEAKINYNALWNNVTMKSNDPKVVKVSKKKRGKKNSSASFVDDTNNVSSTAIIEDNSGVVPAVETRVISLTGKQSKTMTDFFTEANKIEDVSIYKVENISIDTKLQHETPIATSDINVKYPQNDAILGSSSISYTNGNAGVIEDNLSNNLHERHSADIIFGMDNVFYANAGGNFLPDPNIINDAVVFEANYNSVTVPSIDSGFRDNHTENPSTMFFMHAPTFGPNVSVEPFGVNNFTNTEEDPSMVSAVNSMPFDQTHGGELGIVPENTMFVPAYPTFQDVDLVYDLEKTLLYTCHAYNWPEPIFNVTIDSSYIYHCDISLCIDNPFAPCRYILQSGGCHDVQYARNEAAKMALDYIKNIFKLLHDGELKSVMIPWE